MGAFELDNRIVMAPLTRNRAGAGNVPQAINADYYAQRAATFYGGEARGCTDYPFLPIPSQKEAIA